MKSLWFFVVLICVASCRQVHEDKVGSVEEDEAALDFDLLNEDDPKFLNEEWEEMNIKDGDILPDIPFWNFNSLSNKDLESKQEKYDPFYRNSYEVSEEKGDLDSPLFLREDDVSGLFKGKSFYDFESENNDESAKKLENDDWLYPDYADIFNILNKKEEEKKMINKNADMKIIPLPSFETDEEIYDKLPEGKSNNDWSLLPFKDDYDFISYISDKQSEGKNKDYFSNKNFNIDDIQLAYDQLIKMAEDDMAKIKDDKLPEEKGSDDSIQIPIEDDYDFFVGKLDKLNQEMNDMESLNQNANIEVTLLTNAKNKITIRVVSIQDNDRIDNPEIADGKKDLVWEAFPEGKYIDNYEYTDNSGFDERVLAHRYFSRSSMFMVSTVLVVFSIMIFGFCLLCKIFNSKKKGSAYQPLNEEVA